MTAEIQFRKTYNETTGRFTHDPTGVLNIETHAIVMTGPIAGVLTMADGTQYDVTENYIGVPFAHLDELHMQIKAHHNAEGRFLDYGDVAANIPLEVPNPEDATPPTGE